MVYLRGGHGEKKKGKAAAAAAAAVAAAAAAAFQNPLIRAPLRSLEIKGFSLADHSKAAYSFTMETLAAFHTAFHAGLGAPFVSRARGIRDKVCWPRR